MLIKILLILAAIIAVVLILAAFQPAQFQIVRSITVAAPQAPLFAEVNDLHRWPAWSPYEKLDPAMQRTFEGAPAGVGAVYAWTGNREVGAGRMTIVESRPAELIRLRLEFFRPMAGICEAEFSFRPEAGGRTTVTWSMTGTNNYLAKIFCLFMNMDKMVGGQFAQGLASLKALTETAGRK